MIAILQTAVRGMQDQEAKVNASARRIAGAAITPERTTNGPTSTPSSTPSSPADVEPPNSAGFIPDVDIAREMVNMKVAEKIYEANAKVVETAARMIDKTVDIET